MFITTSRVDKSKINEFSANRQRNLGFEDEQPNKVLTLEMVEILVPSAIRPHRKWGNCSTCDHPALLHSRFQDIRESWNFAFRCRRQSLTGIVCFITRNTRVGQRAYGISRMFYGVFLLALFAFV